MIEGKSIVSENETNIVNLSDYPPIKTYSKREIQYTKPLTDESNSSNQKEKPDSDLVEVVRKGKERLTKKPVLCGSGISGSIKVIKKEPTNKAIFVSRLAPEVTISEVSEYLNNQNLKPIKITKLKTKYNSYTSFHVEIQDDKFEELFNAKYWPEGSFISTFYGKLRSEQAIEIDKNTAVSTE